MCECDSVCSCVGEYVFKFVLGSGSDMGTPCVPGGMTASVRMCEACVPVSARASQCDLSAPSLREGLGCLWQDLLGYICEAKLGPLGTQEAGAVVDFLGVTRARSVRPNLSFVYLLPAYSSLRSISFIIKF